MTNNVTCTLCGVSRNPNQIQNLLMKVCTYCANYRDTIKEPERKTNCMRCKKVVFARVKRVICSVCKESDDYRNDAFLYE